jgi:hypothetical protein
VVGTGEEEEEYIVHEDLLCKSSAFFASAAKEEWKEGQEHRIPLPDDSPSIVDLYIHWVYSSRVFSRQRPKEENRVGKEFDLLVGGFIFGEKIQDGDFKDVIIDALIKCISTPDEGGTRWYPTKAWVDRAYEGTPEGSPLRKLLLDMHTFHGNSKWLDGTKSVEFLTDLAGRLLDDQKQPPRHNPIKSDLSSCWYHHHGDDETCYSTKFPENAD